MSGVDADFAVCRLVASLLLGFAPYIYLPLASASNPASTWGTGHWMSVVFSYVTSDNAQWKETALTISMCVGDSTTISGFLTHFLRKEYGTFQLGGQGVKPDPEHFPARLRLYAWTFITEVPIRPIAGLLSFGFVVRQPVIRGKCVGHLVNAFAAVDSHVRCNLDM